MINMKGAEGHFAVNFPPFSVFIDSLMCKEKKGDFHSHYIYTKEGHIPILL